MKSSTPRTMTAVSILVCTLAVAGCGGGGSSLKRVAPAATPTAATVSMTAVTQDGTGYMAPQAGEFTLAAGAAKTSGSVTFTCAAGGDACMVTVAGDGTAKATGGTVTAANSEAYAMALENEMRATDNAMKIAAAAALDTSTEALAALAGPASMEGSTAMMAAKYAKMVGTLGADGDSAAAAMNAQGVLDAKAALETAKADAEAKRAQAQAARAGLEADDPLARVLDGAIARADTQIEMATAVLEATGADSVSAQVKAIVGTDAEMPMTATDAGKKVAMAMAEALAPKSADDGAGLRVVHRETAPPDSVAIANRLVMDDAMGMTFAAIVGEGNLADKRVAATDGGTRPVKALSVDGMKAMDLFATVPETIASTDGTEIDAGVAYKGVPGMLFCAGADCAVAGEGDARTLTGSWYVAADNAMHYYRRGTGDEAGVYVHETDHAIWGHWLSVAADGEATITTFAQAATADGTPADPGNWDEPVADDARLSDSTATYRGLAAGRAVHKTTDSDNVVTNIQSGRFEADVALTARFAVTPTLGGTIENFRAPDGANPGAVDASWRVTLTETEAFTGTVKAGVADASGQDGAWTANAYGTPDKRATGIYGGFNAHFTDGHVAGAYATRQE